MALQTNNSNILLGAGKLFFKRSGEGSYRFLGDCSKAEIDVSERETFEFKSSVEKARPTSLEVTTSQTPKINLTMNELDPENVALALMGTVGEYTQPNTAVTNEVHNAVQQGGYIKLAKRGPISSVVVEPAGGGTAYTVTTDYVIEDSTEGLIYIVPGGGIADGANVQVDYTPTAIVANSGRPIVPLASLTKIEGALLFLGDPTNGPKYRGEFPKVSLTSEAVVGLIQPPGESASVDITVKIISDAANNPTFPLGRVELIGTAS